MRGKMPSSALCQQWSRLALDPLLSQGISMGAQKGKAAVAAETVTMVLRTVAAAPVEDDLS